MQGTAIPNLDMGAASIKMNDDGSFNLLVGATDLGTGSDTVLTQMAAEVLGCPPEDFITYSSDTDFTPFDVGAYASSTTYISGAAVVVAARKVAEQIKAVAGQILDVPAEEIMLAERQAWADDGRSVTLAEIALHSLHKTGQHQIMAVGSYVSPDSPPPFAAQFADVTVDTATGQVTVNKLVMVLDCGMIVNPAAAVGQIEGGMTQALGYAVCEEMLFDETRPAGQSALRRLPHLHRRRDAGDGGAFRADLRADASVRRQGRGRDPAGWRGAGRGERGLQRHRRADPDHPADAGARVAGIAEGAAVK